jgi:hypothetical protein
MVENHSPARYRHQAKFRLPDHVAPGPGIADMFVEIDDEQRRGWFLSYSVRL